MEDSLSYSYPVPDTEVLAMFRHPDYIAKKHTQMNQHNVRLVEHIDQDHYYRLTISRELGGLLPEAIPAFSRRWLDGLLTLTTTIEWHIRPGGVHNGRNTIAIEGAPLRAHIDYQLVPLDNRCEHRQIIVADVTTPFLRAQLEHFALEGIKRIQKRDWEYNLTWLRGEPYVLPGAAGSAVA